MKISKMFEEEGRNQDQKNIEEISQISTGKSKSKAQENKV